MENFLADIWTVLLSDDEAEVGDALKRIEDSEVAAAVARAALAPPPDADDGADSSTAVPRAQRGRGCA